MPRFGQVLAHRRSATILPHDGIVQRFARAAVPGNNGLTLIGNANRCYRLVDLRTQLSERLHRGRPDLCRVVFDPPWLGEVLGKFTIHK